MVPYKEITYYTLMDLMFIGLKFNSILKKSKKPSRNLHEEPRFRFFVLAVR